MQTLKPGWQSSEFVVVALAIVGAVWQALLSQNVVDPHGQLANAVTTVATILVALGYAGCRTFLKSQALAQSSGTPDTTVASPGDPPPTPPATQ